MSLFNNKDEIVRGMLYRKQMESKTSIFVLNERSEKKRSFSRAGGRSKKKETDQPKKQEQANGIFNPIKNIIPLLLLFAIINNLFGFMTGGDGSTIYYSSTVYEKTFIDENGQIQRLRKENVQSNVPSLINSNNDKVLRDSAKLEINSNFNSFDDMDTEMDRIFRAATIRNDLF